LGQRLEYREADGNEIPLSCSSCLRLQVSAMRDMGKLLLVVGIVTALLGFLFWSGLAPRWLGRLPGDIRIERGNSTFYFPIVTCIIISIVLSLIFSIFRR
jgi:hypothetical protein